VLRRKNTVTNISSLLLTGRISKVCSVPLFSVIVSESTVAAGESVEAAKGRKKNQNKVCQPKCFSPAESTAHYNYYIAGYY